MATFSLRATAPHQLNCKCWPTSWAALPPDLFRASVCSLCIYRLFCSCPQTALQICRNSKLVPWLQCGPWCITFSSVNPLTLTAILIWQEFGGILLNKKRTGSEGLWISSYIYCLDVCLLCCCCFFFPLPMIKKKTKKKTCQFHLTEEQGQGGLNRSEVNQYPPWGKLRYIYYLCLNDFVLRGGNYVGAELVSEGTSAVKRSF